MSDEVEVRPAEADDADRVRSVVRSSATASYAMSPDEIETLVEEAFADEPQAAKRDGDDALLVVAETGGVLAGVAEARLDETVGTVRRLHVDPERRGAGVGTRLFEHTVDALRGDGADRVQAAAVDAATEAGAFYESFGFELVADGQVDIEGLGTVEALYADADADDVDASDPDGPAADTSDPDETLDFPETVTVDDERVYLGDDRLTGNEAPFAPTYADAGQHENFGYYCGNCGGTDVAVGSADELRCQDCGNTHRSSEEYDGSYL